MSSGWSERLRLGFVPRLALWYALLFVLSATALLATTYLLLARSLEAQDHRVLESTVARYAGEYELGGLRALERTIAADSAEGLHERLLVRVVSRQAEVVYLDLPPSWSHFDLGALDRPFSSRFAWIALRDPSRQAVLEVGTMRLPDGLTVQVGRSSAVRDEMLRHFRSQAAAVLGLIVVVGLLGGALLTHLGLTPVRALETMVRGIIGTGRLEARVAETPGRDPLNRLGGLVNKMLARIERLVAGMRRALDNVAHDLRTPLTRLRNIAEAGVLASGSEAKHEALVRVLDEVDRVTATLAALIDISEAEAGAMALHREPVRLAEVVAESISLYEDAAQDKGLALGAAVDPDLSVSADRVRLRQVLANLIDNAVKYTPPGGEVKVAAHRTGPDVVVEVRDTGGGIAAGDLPHVWDRLYRGDASRSERGLGLGLSLVKAVVERHGGQVAVTSSPGAGSVFSLSLPAVPDVPGDEA
jgi:signal transduction histidine kinase